MSAWHEHLVPLWLTSKDAKTECSLHSPRLSLLNLNPTLSAVSCYCHVHPTGPEQGRLFTASSPGLCWGGAQQAQPPSAFAWPCTENRNPQGIPQGARLPHRDLLKHRFSINAATVVYGESKEWEEEKGDSLI